MARKQVYHTKAWKEIRKGYAMKRYCLCERCMRPVYVDGLSDYLPKKDRLTGIVHHKDYLTEENFNDPLIAYDEKNLELLCIECHNKEHMTKSVRSDVCFDAFGNLIRK